MPANRLFNKAVDVLDAMEIRMWLTSNYFKVNDHTSGFLPIVPEPTQNLVDKLSTSFGDPLIQTVDKSSKPWCLRGQSHEHVCQHIINRLLLLFPQPSHRSD